MITQNLPALKINKLSDAQYEREKTNERLDTTAIYLTPDTSINYTTQALTDVQKAQARTNIDAVSHTELDTKIVNETISYGSVIQNSNPFGGRKLYINSLDNAFASLDKKFWVKVTYHKCTDEADPNITYPYEKIAGSIEDLDYWVDSEPFETFEFGTKDISHLFDNCFETCIKIPANSYAKIHIRFSNEADWTPLTGKAASEVYGTYPYGNFYLSYYYDKLPNLNKRSHYRCYNKTNDYDHIKGWKKIDFSYYVGDANSGVNVVENVYDGKNFHRTCLEFIIFSNETSETWISQLEWKKDRPDFSKNTPILHNYGPNSVYNNMYFKTHESDPNVTITPSGSISAKEITVNNLPVVPTQAFDDSWEDDAIFVFDKATKSFKYSGKTLSSFKEDIQDEMKAYMAQFIAEYVENYMSSETIIYPDGTTETTSDILYVNGTTTEISNEDSSTTLYVEEE
ncbi:MAG: hypothetical protein J6A25_00805 [Lachnospiraceae bacterium]|nr:hypothetical protein [Lachnospiraceae bacterium]